MLDDTLIGELLRLGEIFRAQPTRGRSIVKENTIGLALVCVIGCALALCPARASDEALPADAAPPTEAADKAGGDVMAVVNGQSLPMAKLNELLTRIHGMAIAQQLIANEVVRQAAAAEGLSVTDAEIAAENEQTLKRIFGHVSGEGDRERLLAQLLAQKGVSREQWDMTMRRNAVLRKLAEAQVTVTPDDLREQFAEQYGRKVVVRHIQTASLAEAEDVYRKLLDGADFAELAQKRSTNASARTGGLLPPIGARAVGLPPAMRDLALSLKKPGELTEPIQIGTTFHVLKLERIIEPRDVKLEDVKVELEAEIRDRKIAAMQQSILRRLLESADIEFVNPILKAQQPQDAEGT